MRTRKINWPALLKLAREYKTPRELHDEATAELFILLDLHAEERILDSLT